MPHIVFDDVDRHACGVADVLPVLVDQRERERRQTEQETFGRCGHRARIERVFAHVLAVVDTRDDDIGAIVEYTRQGNVHTVGRRPVHIPKAARGIEKRQGPRERQ